MRCRSAAAEATSSLAKVSANAHHSPDRANQLRRVISHAILEHPFDILDIFDVRTGIALDDHQVCGFAHLYCADAIEPPEITGTVGRADMDRLKRREARLDQQFNFALIAKSR